ncbi:protein spdB [Kitasatospora sp. NPDC098652]|uniref:protein spdB n=1 Tax=Kitasatospora sp. NPDC098652 TaxID=3364095 RepID=UPI003814EF85
MNRQFRRTTTRVALAAPAIAVTAVSAVLTVAVVALWLQGVMPLALALVIGLGYDGAWLAALAYERRLAGQGDHNGTVTALGWVFGALTTGMLVVHALTSPHTAGWLAVAWLPLAAKTLWWLHSIWESTEISPKARAEIRRVLQDSRDTAAISRAVLSAQTHGERIRMDALSRTGAALAGAQAKTARALAEAWAELEEVSGEDDESSALQRIVAPASPAWELPVWTPLSALRPTAALPGGDAADIRPEPVKAQASAVQPTGALRPDTEHAPAPKPASVASLVRLAVAEVGDDPKAVTAWVSARTTKAVRPDTVAREIRSTRNTPTDTKAGARFGFAAGRN